MPMQRYKVGRKAGQWLRLRFPSGETAYIEVSSCQTMGVFLGIESSEGIVVEMWDDGVLEKVVPSAAPGNKVPRHPHVLTD